MRHSSSALLAAAAALVIPTSGLFAAVLNNPTITLGADGFNPNFVAAKVFDSARSEFATSGNGAGTSLSNDIQNGTWINFDFGLATTIDRFVMVARQNPVDVVGQSQLIFSSDNIFDAGDPAVVFDPSGANAHGFIQAFAPQTAQFVRWEVLTSGGASQNLGATEMRFLNTPPLQEIIEGVVAYNAAPDFSPQYAKENAAGGNNDAGIGSVAGVEYASQGQGTNMFIDFDLGSAQAIAGFDYFDRLSETEDVSGFDLIFSDDPAFGSVIETKSYVHPAGDGYTTSDTFASPVNARYVRLDATFVDGAGTNTGVAEMIFYAQVPEPTSLGCIALAGIAMLARRRRTR